MTILTDSLGGYKQPQQLLTLAYYISLGAEFDTVINIDGFNEVALPPIHNIPKNIYPFYPVGHYLRTSDLIDTGMLDLLIQDRNIDVTRKGWAKIFGKYIFT